MPTKTSTSTNHIGQCQFGSVPAGVAWGAAEITSITSNGICFGNRANGTDKTVEAWLAVNGTTYFYRKTTSNGLSSDANSGWGRLHWGAIQNDANGCKAVQQLWASGGTNLYYKAGIYNKGYNIYSKGGKVTLSVTYKIKAQCQYYDGSNWKQCLVQYYDGSKWVNCTVQYYDGTNWKSLTV